MKNKKMIFIIIGAVIAIAIIGSVMFYNNGISAVSSESKEVVVSIKGSGKEILNDLDEAGLIKDKFCANIYLKLSSSDTLKANTYIFNENMSLSEIFNIIETGEFKYVLKSKLTIKEGTTIPTVAEEVAKLLEVSKDEVIKKWSNQDYLKSLAKEYWFIDEKTILNKELKYPLEGYLYPETYYVTDEKPTIESVTKLSLDMMDKNLTPLKDKITAFNWTPHQFLSFASVVERESGVDETDRPMISGVFMNRLKQGMLLQSDITVNYAWQRVGVDVSYKHLEIDSKYNTYKYTGLPVGPISTVPVSTMEDCINYSKHDYLYFFAMKDSKDTSKTVVVYTKTHQEHTSEVKKARDANLWLD
ncbi:MAG: endolytic transglycosylase MltG [Coprobacillus sp.]